MSESEQIRDIIRRNAKELNDYGVLTTVVETSGALGGRPATVYYLNKEQALIVAMLSAGRRGSSRRGSSHRDFRSSRARSL